jgi:hypothetical protein
MRQRIRELLADYFINDRFSVKVQTIHRRTLYASFADESSPQIQFWRRTDCAV